MEKLQQSAIGYGLTKESVDYWTNHRNTISDLYESEKYFMLQNLSEAKKILDIGCAAGGSANFSREINPSSTYFGVDVSANLIQTAKDRFKNKPETFFQTYDGKSLPFETGTFDFAFSLGVFHHVKDWQSLCREALRVADCFVFDIRLWDNDSIKDSPDSYIKMPLEDEFNADNRVPYNIISFNETFRFFTELKNDGYQVDVYSYYHTPNKLTVIPTDKILMTMIQLKKNSHHPQINFLIN